jgi:hypothetical protein
MFPAMPHALTPLRHPINLGLRMTRRTHRPPNRIVPLHNKCTSAQAILRSQALLVVFLPAFTLLPSVLQELKMISTFIRALRLGEYRLPLCAICEDYILAGASARSAMMIILQLKYGVGTVNEPLQRVHILTCRKD